MKSTVTQLDDNQVRVEVEVAEDELGPALDAAAREISRTVNLKGFRRGKIPRKVLERHIGAEPIYEEAVKHAIPARLAELIEAEDLDMIGRPEIADVEGGPGEPLTFTASFAVRPEIEIGDLASIEVKLDGVIDATDDEINDEIDNLRERFATPVEVSRPAREGDYCVINLDASIHGERIDDLSRSDLMYEVGSGTYGSELDENLTGAKAGEIVKFNTEIPEGAPVHGGEEVSFNVLVKDVKEKKLPALDDDWVQEASEFDTVDELRDEIRSSITAMKRARAREEVHQKAIDAIVAENELTIPDTLIEEEIDRRQHDLAHQIEGSGMSFEDFLAHQGESLESFREQMRDGARSSVEGFLVMAAVVREHEIQATPAEVDERIAGLAEREGTTTSRLRKQLEEAGRLDAIRNAIVTAKTATALVEGVAVVDADEQPVALDVGEDGDAEDAAEADEGAVAEASDDS